MLGLAGLGDLSLNGTAVYDSKAWLKLQIIEYFKSVYSNRIFVV